MKMKALLVLVFSIASYVAMASDGITFRSGTWASVLEEAKRQQKPVFVDFYATWCGPCKQLSRDVFTLADLGTFFNQNLISYKVNAEEEELQLVEQIDLEAFPTLVFFDPNGQILAKHVGYIEGEDLMVMAKNVASYGGIKKKVEANTATPQEMLQFLSMAKNSDAEIFAARAPQIVAGFTAEDLINSSAWAVFEATVADIRSKEFKMAIDHAAELSMHPGYWPWASQILDSHLRSTAESGVQADLAPLKESLQKLYIGVAQIDRPYDYFDGLCDHEYFFLKNDIPNYSKTLIAWMNQYHGDDAEKLSQYGVALAQASNEKANQATALAWADKAVQIDRSINTVYSLAKVYELSNHKDLALKAAKELLTFELSDQDRDAVNEFIATLK